MNARISRDAQKLHFFCLNYVWLSWVTQGKEKRHHWHKILFINPTVKPEHVQIWESANKTTDCVPEFAGAEAAGSSESLRRPHSICLCGKPPLYSFFQPFAGTLWQPSRRLAKMWRWRQMDESAWALLHLWHTEGRYRIIHLRGWCGIQTGSDLLYLQMILPRWPS